MEAHNTQKNDVYLGTIQDVALNAKRMFDNDQRTPDFIPFGTFRIINLDLIEWTDDVSREITQMFVDQANSQENSLSFLERLKRMFEAERLAIEKKIGSDEFDRDKQIIFGVKFHSDYQSGLNESRKFANCIDQAINQLKKGKKNEYSFSDYLSCENKEAVIEKIRALDHNTPKKIYIILKALFDHGSLLLSDNETIYKAYFEEFSYHLSYDTMKKGLNSYYLDKTDKTNSSKIENMINHLFD